MWFGLLGLGSKMKTWECDFGQNLSCKSVVSHISYLCYLVKTLVTMVCQVIQTRLVTVLIFRIIRESAVDVTLQDVVGHVKVSGRVLKLFP